MSKQKTESHRKEVIQMTLPKKYRFKEPALKDKVRVNLNDKLEPENVRFKHTSWDAEKELKILGRSKESDLTPSSLPVDILADLISSNQYILADNDANIYEAYIYVIKTDNGIVGWMNAIKTSPHN